MNSNIENAENYKRNGASISGKMKQINSLDNNRINLSGSVLSGIVDSIVSDSIRSTNVFLEKNADNTNKIFIIAKHFKSIDEQLSKDASSIGD